MPEGPGPTINPRTVLFAVLFTVLALAGMCSGVLLVIFT
jgi:hypothetical protein